MLHCISAWQGDGQRGIAASPAAAAACEAQRQAMQVRRPEQLQPSLANVSLTFSKFVLYCSQAMRQVCIYGYDTGSLWHQS